MNIRAKRAAFGILSMATALVFAFPAPAMALVGPHSYTNSTTGDVFLGGDYIEVGISSYGSFGTDSGEALPPGFFGTAARSNIGMSTNPAGFGETPDLRMDFFLPGTPEERWVIGYKIAGTPSTGSNSLLEGPHDIADYAVVDETSGDLVKATGSGTFNGNLEITQVISFDRADKFFKNQVTLENIGAQALDSVRYMRSFDPDNTKDQGGDYATQNQILFTHEAGDEKAVVMSDTTNNPSDPVFATNGSRSPILFYSSDNRARVSTFGFDNTDPYAASAYDSAAAKGTSNDADEAITITVDVGTLAIGETATFAYYTSLDNRDFSEVLDDIEEDEGGSDDGDGIDKAIEDAAPNGGDGNGDGTADSLQTHVSSLPNPVVGGGAYQTVEVTDCTGISSLSINPESDYGSDEAFDYPVGLTDFSINCSSPGDTAILRIFFDQEYDTADWQARKFIGGEFIDIEGATWGTTNVGGQTVTTMTYQLTDGGQYDADGVANGEIVDPTGPAVSSNPGAPDTGFKPSNSMANIWSIIMLASGLGLISLAIFRHVQTRL